MALAAVAYAKAMRRRQIMVATSSIGPGATNMVTAAAVAHANRLPLLILAGDTFASRIPDPVLQQVEGFGDPSVTVNDAFKPVVRYWDRMVRPEQVVHTLPHAVATMLDPATCGPAFLGLPQDVQADAYDFPARFFEPAVHEIPRPRPDAGQLARAAAALAGATQAADHRRRRRPLLAGRGGAEGVRRAAQHPGRGDRGRQGHAAGLAPAQRRADRLDRVHVGQRAGRARPTSCSPSGPACRTSRPAPGRCSATRRCASSGSTRPPSTPSSTWPCPLVADAREGLAELSDAGGRLAGAGRLDRADLGRGGAVPRLRRQDRQPQRPVPRGAAHLRPGRRGHRPPGPALPTTRCAAAGGFPGELNSGWRAKGLDSIDMEYGYSCMGYEISGAWGAKMAHARP